MKTIYRMMLGGVSVFALSGTPFAHANGIQKPTVASTIQTDSRLLSDMKQNLSFRNQGVRNLNIVEVTPEGRDKATVLFRFSAAHRGKQQEFLGVGELERKQSVWRMTSWGCGGYPSERAKMPFTLARDQYNDETPVYYGQVNDRSIKRIVVETSGRWVDVPVMNSANQSYFFGRIPLDDLAVDAVKGINGEGKLVYQINTVNKFQLDKP